MQKPKVLSWVLFTLLALIWGSSFILMKRSAAALNGWQIGSVRILAAGAIALPFAFFHLRQIPRNKLMLVFLSGIMGNLLPAFLFAIAIVNKVNSSVAGILNAMTPLFVILIGLTFFSVRVVRRQWLGVAV